MKTRRRTARSAARSILALTPLLVPATSLAAETNQGQSSSREIEEMIVTSRRVEENIQDVPVAVTAFSEEFINRLAPRTLRDFDGLAPNVRIGMNTAGPSAGAIFIRGIGYADIEKTQSPAVSVILDGVQQGSSTGQLIDAFDLAHIEINRGPQGVLQGKNTTGGAIVVNRVKPDFEDFGWKTSLMAGNYGERQLKARLNIPLVDDQLAMKIGYGNQVRDGFYDNDTIGREVGKVDHQLATIALRWQPEDWVDVLLTYDWIKDRGDIPPQDPRYNGRDPFENEANFDEFQQYDLDGLTLNIDMDLGFGTLTSITGWQGADDDVGQDFDGSTRRTSAIPLAQLHTLREQKYEQFSEELKLTGDLIDDELRYVVGVFYWETDLQFQQGTNQVLQLPGPALGLPVGLTCAAAGLLVSPVLGEPFCQVGPLFADHRASEEVTSKAVFASLSWNPIENVEIGGGVRYLEEKKKFQTQFGTRLAPGGPVDEFGGPILPPRELATVFAGFPVSGDDEWDDVVFELTGKWQYTDDNNVYGSYRQGFRSGGFSIRATDPSNLSYEPENVDQWEIGSKNDFFDGILRLNLAGFVTTLEGAQFSSILTTVALPGTNTLILNASEDFNIWGVEAEAVIQATDELSFQLTVGRQKTEGDGDTHSCLVRPFNPSGSGCNPAENPALFAPNAGPLPNVTIEGGAQGFAAPDYNWAFVTAYAKEIGQGVFAADIAVKATDDVFIYTNNGLPVFEDGYILVDASLSYQWNFGDGSSFLMKATGKNITDEEYVEQELELGNGGFRGWGPPAQYALELTWQH